MTYDLTVIFGLSESTSVKNDIKMLVKLKHEHRAMSGLRRGHAARQALL